MFFVDTSAWYALLDPTEAAHRAASTVLRTHRRRFARGRLGWSVARAFGEEVRAGRMARLERVTADDEDAAWDIFVRYRDQAFSFTDCTSFALMRRLRLDTAISLDADFRTFGFVCLP